MWIVCANFVGNNNNLIACGSTTTNIMKTTNKSGKSVYKIITERVIEGLEKDGLKWFKPWTNQSNGVKGYAINYSSKRYYEGLNCFLLTGAIAQYGYTSCEFITSKQAVENGGTINEDAKDHLVVYWMISFTYKGVWYKNEKQLNLKTGMKANSKGVKKHASPRYYKVYNLNEVTGIKGLSIKELEDAAKGTIFEPIYKAEEVYSSMPKKPTLKHSGNRAYYKVASHHVQMPIKNQFTNKTGLSGDYYKTLFHELVHSTGHEDLLNRKTLVETSGFRSENYSKEELVAEMGSMFLVGLLDIETTDNDENSQAYINGWLTELKKEENEKDVLFASIQARKAVEFILQK
jgi:antirestriction protein ArdC